MSNTIKTIKTVKQLIAKLQELPEEMELMDEYLVRECMMHDGYEMKEVCLIERDD